MPTSGAVTIRIVANGDVIPAYSISNIPIATAEEIMHEEIKREKKITSKYSVSTVVIDEIGD